MRAAYSDDVQRVDEMSRGWLRGRSSVDAVLREVLPRVSELATGLSDVCVRHWGDVDAETFVARQHFVLEGVAYYERSDRLRELTMPVLWIAGLDDEVRPETLAFYQSLTPASELAVIDDAGHVAHLERPERYLAVIRDVLARVDRRSERLP